MTRTTAVLCAFVLGVGALLLVDLPRSPTAGGQGTGASAGAVAQGDVWSGGSAQDGAVRHHLPGVLPIVADQALARAYAAVGQASQGDRAALAALDDTARARLDEAQALWASTPVVRRGVGAASPAGDVRPPAGSGTGGAATTAAARLPTGGIPPAARVLDLSHAVNPATALQNTPQGPVLVAPGLWAKVAYDPQSQRQLVITDACRGGYAVAVYGTDFSTVRLDGGLVVPGQYYQVNGAAVLTGSAHCSVDIRPLSALASYAPAPARPPQTNG